MGRIPFIFICFILCVFRTGKATAADTLLGFSYDSWLVSLLPETGAITAYHVQLPVYGGRRVAYDPLRHIVFASGMGYGGGEYLLFSIDPQTLAVGSVAVTGVGDGYIDSLAVDPRPGHLYAATDAFTPTGSRVLEINSQTGIATPVSMFPGISLTAITFDPSTGILYGIAAPGSSITNPPAVVRVDLQSGTLVTLYQSTAANAFHDLAVIPGTLSFYMRVAGGGSSGLSFAMLDAATGKLTSLGSDVSTTDQVSYQDFPVAPRAVPDGNLTYAIEDVCFPAVCLADVLNDEGAIAGSATGAGLDNSIFVKSRGSGIRYVPGGNTRTVPLSMNNRGDIVGYTDDGKAAFLYSASSDRFYRLNDLFEGQFGQANYINNHGDIVGNASVPPQAIAGYQLAFISGITDSGIVLGRFRNDTGFVLLTDGSPIYPEFPPVVFNNSGRFLTFLHGGMAGATLLYTPGAGFRVLPGNTTQFGFPVGLNDAGLGFFHSTEGPGARVFDTSGSIPELSNSFLNAEDLAVPRSTWSNFRAVAVNNAGQLAVLATNISTGRRTTLLLTPNFSAAAHPAVRPLMRRSLHTGEAAAFSLNGMRLDAQRLAESRRE